MILHLFDGEVKCLNRTFLCKEDWYHRSFQLPFIQLQFFFLSIFQFIFGMRYVEESDRKSIDVHSNQSCWVQSMLPTYWVWVGLYLKLVVQILNDIELSSSLANEQEVDRLCVNSYAFRIHISANMLQVHWHIVHLGSFVLHHNLWLSSLHSLVWYWDLRNQILCKCT